MTKLVDHLSEPPVLTLESLVLLLGGVGCGLGLGLGRSDHADNNWRVEHRGVGLRGSACGLLGPGHAIE